MSSIDFYANVVTFLLLLTPFLILFSFFGRDDS